MSSTSYAYTQLHAEVDSIRERTSALEYIDGTFVVGTNQLVSGTLEVGPIPTTEDDHDPPLHNTIPTLLDDVSVQSHHINTHHLLVQNDADISFLTVGSIKIRDKINLQSCTGPVGPRGPCGYATNTGCTGPAGSSNERLTDITGFPSSYGPVGTNLVCCGEGVCFQPQNIHVDMTASTAVSATLPNIPVSCFQFQEPRQEVMFTCRVSGVAPIMSCHFTWDWVASPEVEHVEWEAEYVVLHPNSLLPTTTHVHSCTISPNTPPHTLFSSDFVAPSLRVQPHSTIYGKLRVLSELHDGHVNLLSMHAVLCPHDIKATP